jgi:hypothetical protein
VKLVYVFMTLGEARLVAGIDDGAGKFRRITTTWQAKENPHLPPPTWAETVRGEAEFQRAEDAHPNPVRKFL